MPDSGGVCQKGTRTVLATQSDVTALAARVSTLEAQNTTLTSQISALQLDNTLLKNRATALETTLSKVSYDPTGLNGKPTVKIDGANLQVVSGSGTTGGTVNGLGNVIVGYDEHGDTNMQTGSHNIVLGNYQDFESYSGLLAGRYNKITEARR